MRPGRSNMAVSPLVYIFAALVVIRDGCDGGKFGGGDDEPISTLHMEDQTYWRGVALSELNKSLQMKLNNGVAKNVIVFVGDGMGISTVTAARIYHGQVKDNWGEASTLSFESFPFTGLSKTYSTTRQTPDSAATATAMFTGVKTTQEVIGLDTQAQYNSCNRENNKIAEIESFMAWGQSKGKDTGIVTTTRVTHATPAATYAHTNNRDWECDSVIPPNLRHCLKDITRQLVEDAPGKNFKVILGGGRRTFGNMTVDNSDDTCFRSDGKNLVNDWRKNKTNAVFVATNAQLAAVDTSKTDHLLGLFAPGHLKYAGENHPMRPTLKEMTMKAINVLKKNPKGFFLMVEGGAIDLAHHENYPKLALMEVMEFNDAIAAANSEVDPSETLIIATADHSHAFTLAGYSSRGSDVFGFADSTNESFYEILTYANGPGYATHHIPVLSANCTKSNCTKLEQETINFIKDDRNAPDRDDIHYRHSSSRYLKSATHGGEDVSIYAQGPKAHLLTGVHEQNYIAHVISCASCTGPHEELCCSRKFSNHSSAIGLSASSILLACICGMHFIMTFSMLPSY